MFDWKPDYLTAGKYNVTFTATDDGNGTGIDKSTSITVPITVLHTNRPPQITDISNITLNPGVVQDIPVQVLDPDNYPLTLKVQGQSGYDIPNFATFTDNGDGTGILHVAPTDNDGGMI